MKTIAAALFLAAALTSFGQPETTSPSQPISVHIASEIEDLARGYAAAFPVIAHTPVFVYLRREGGTAVLVSPRRMKAQAGVLIIELENGFTYIINPEDVIAITDAPPPKAAPGAPRP